MMKDKCLIFDPDTVSARKFLEVVAPRLQSPHTEGRVPRKQHQNGDQAEWQDPAQHPPPFELECLEAAFTVAVGKKCSGSQELGILGRKCQLLCHIVALPVVDVRFSTCCKEELSKHPSRPLSCSCLVGSSRTIDFPCVGRLDAEMDTATRRMAGILKKLPREITPVNLEELRRVKQALVEVESKADQLRFLHAPLFCHLPPIQLKATQREVTWLLKGCVAESRPWQSNGFRCSNLLMNWHACNAHVRQAATLCFCCHCHSQFLTDDGSQLRLTKELLSAGIWLKKSWMMRMRCET